MCVFLAVQLSLKLLAHKPGVDTMVLNENKGPFPPSKSDYVETFWVHLVHMA
jgi:hypothetical protein